MSYILYGVPHSYYTGKVRSYLRLQGIDYQERSPGHPNFAQQVLPAIGRSIIPVLVTPDAEIIQDSVDIIAHFERRGVRYPAYPNTPLRFIVALLIEYYGSQAMLKHAMHYRWSYLAQQEKFLQHAFGSAKVMQRMASYLPRLGVNAESIPQIEASYQALIAHLDTHFDQHPFVLGDRPSIADYGLMGPLYAHLGRDPVPAHIMKLQAPALCRWLERMLAPNLDLVEFGGRLAPVSGDSIPPSLAPVLQHIATEIFPELSDKFAFLDAWFASEQPADGTPVAAKPHQRQLGMITTSFRGAPIEVGVEPYLLYLLQPAADRFAQLPAPEQSRVSAWLQKHGLLAALPLNRPYTVGRSQNLEVWRHLRHR